jgi:phosphomannomutase
MQQHATTPKTIYHFGTSGYRNNTDAGFNQAVVEQITHAIADVLIEQMTQDWHQVRPVLLGGDTRQKTKEAIPVIMAILQARGLDVYQIEGDVPTPVLAYAAAYLKDLTGCDTPAAGAILMTVSHNPWDYGGYNFLTPEGAVAPSSLSQLFEARQATPSHAVLNREAFGANATPFKRTLQPYQAYFKHLKNRVGLSAAVFEEQPIQVFYDPLYATGRHYFPKLMEDFGVIATTIHDDDNRPEGYTGEPEPSAENLVELSQLVQASGTTNPMSMGFSNDGDADRFGVLDETGAYLQPNFVLLLVLFWLGQKPTTSQNEAVVVRSQATTHAVDELAASFGLPILQTPVGYKYIAETFIEHEEEAELAPVIFGGESSGGLSIGGHIPEKDGLLANLIVADLIASQKKPLSHVLSSIITGLENTYHFAEWTIKTSEKDSILAQAQRFFTEGGSMGKPCCVVDVEQTQHRASTLKNKFGTQDGIKLYLTNGSWVLVRASGTEPIIRLYLEAVGETPEVCETVFENLSSFWLTIIAEKAGVTADKIVRKF